MGRESEDKTERILSIYARLKQGKVIYKEKESLKYGVTERTIQRDISDIQCFLKNQNIDTGIIQEIIFDKNIGGYILQIKHRYQLEGKEILALAKILLGNPVLLGSELLPVLHKIIRLCSEEKEAELVTELLKKEMETYRENSDKKYKKPLMDMIWELEQAIRKQNEVEIQYDDLQNKKVEKEWIKPIRLVLEDGVFYLYALAENIEIRKDISGLL